ncbi:MAG: hypothetical protein A2Y82_03135 [Candidatus Buchananbacteria bacterium RBG_13_36_9]|uniref:ArnR1-like winged helix-turn-helix domain-containing protein n=1 Tax=Candidatus Buchananbacteria bacterium RBG_13_36_9 TaxID=1797530 RepID=A0A1G1XRD9_9BACT|nr:MAG: hypothetical protein A2Y82_03135 [Candidatus Buchananbacteria bacterium RBG_13_36_9]
MRLSKLQKYILLQSFDTKNKLDRKVLLGFYHAYKKKPSREIMVNSITSSIERLIKKGLIVGFGELTKEKTYIDKIRLTPLGKKIAKKFLGEQKKLPFKLKK